MSDGPLFSPPALAHPSHSSAEQQAANSAQQEAAAADALFDTGQFAAARFHYLQATRLQPHESKFFWLLGICESRLGQNDQAGRHLQTAVRLNPQFAFAQATLAEWYLTQGMVESALDASAKAQQLAPANYGVQVARAASLEAAGELDAAWALVQELAGRGHATRQLAIQYARLARGRDHQDTGLAMIDQLLRAGGISPEDQSSLHFAAAGLLDDKGLYDHAFAHAAHGNALRPSTYDPAAHQRTIDQFIAYFTREKISCLPKATYRSEKPVFVVGMPRSGTSLVEQILASHPQVYGAGELDFLYRVLIGTMDMVSRKEPDYPACLDSLAISHADGMAQIYLEPLGALSPTALRIVDKMPLNFLHLGLIAILLPHAKVIHCRRDPMDTCLSCYFTPFTTGNDFKYDLAHLGLFYRQYERLMAHWKSVLDLTILDVSYEEVVARPQEQSRRLIEFIGLPWDDRCLRFHETRRPVSTASVLQVRKPVYETSIQRWRRYEKHLGPLKVALG